LHVDDDVAVQRRSDLGQTIGSAWMVIAGHANLAAEPADCFGNPQIVGGDDRA
jgi:hypothetical protein